MSETYYKLVWKYKREIESHSYFIMLGVLIYIEVTQFLHLQLKLQFVLC